MPDFSKLAKHPAGVAKRPTALPVSSSDPYPGLIKSFEFVEADKRRNPPPNYDTIIRMNLALTGWPDGVDEGDREEEVEAGVRRPIDLSKRQMRKDFYDHRLDQLDDFLRSCGIDLGTPDSPRPYEEVLPEVVGQSVTIEVQQYLNQRTNEIGNQVGILAGTGG